MADTPEQEIVSAISAAGWLQGDTVSGDALIEHISEEVLKAQFEGAACSGLLTPDTHLGENARHREVSDDQTTPYVYP